MTTDDDWTYRLVVVDLDAVYLPNEKGGVDALTLHDPPDPTDIADFGEGFGLRHGHTGVGHIYLSPRVTDRFGLVVDEDLTATVAELGLNEREDLRDWRSKRNVAAAEQLAQRGETFVAQLRKAGWEVDRLRPRFTIRRPDPDDPHDRAKARVFTVVLEAYSYMWEAKEDDPSGPDQKDWPLPDPDDAPAQYCTQLAARLGRAGELLGVPWQSSAAGTGAELLDRLPVRMKKNQATGQTETDWRRHGKEPVPEQALRTRRAGGQHMWEPHHKWSRVPNEEELSTATEVWLLDERGSYLPRAASLAFGYGPPEQMDPADVIALLTAGKAVYGLGLVDLPTWDVAGMPPPHPDMTSEQINRRWTSMRTPWLLANMHKHSDYGPEQLENALVEAWVWPKTHRFFGKWGEKVRGSRTHADQQAELAEQQALAATDEGQRVSWEIEAANWRAVEMMSKNVYAGYFGKLASRRVLRAGSERYHHHYRPLAQATVWGEQRIQAWIKLAKYAQGHGVFPLFAAGTDSYGYLAPTLAAMDPQPDVDDGRYGKLRVKHKVALTDKMREQLLAGVDGYRVFDTEITRLYHGGRA